MLIIGIEGNTLNSKTKQTLTEHTVSGWIAFDRNLNGAPKNIIDPQQTKQLNQTIEALNPALWRAVDCEGGDRLFSEQHPIRKGVNRLKADYGFADTLCAQDIGTLYEKGERAQAREACEHIAHMLHHAGFNLVFAPLVDININPKNPIVGQLYRCFSLRVNTVVECALLFIEACRRYNIQCVLKHFPGHGSARHDSHLELVDITDTWQRQELIPYRELANECGMVMMGHLLHRGIDPKRPASLSKCWIEDVLRGDLGFNGLVVSDDAQMRGLLPFVDTEAGAIAALKAAGNDLIIVGNQLTPPPG